MMLRTHQTLLDQMKISDAEIQSRLELAALSLSHFELLKDVLPLINAQVDSIVERFYISQLAIDEIAVLIGDADTLNRLKGAQHQYILDLFSGQYDSTYVNNRLRIGMVHKRIGVEPKLYLSAICSLKLILFEVLDQSMTDAEVLRQTKEALDKLLYFDTTLVFDTYISSMISELELAKKKTEMYANSLEVKVSERTAQLEELAKKDPLTGINNQRAMRELASVLLASLTRRKASFALIYFDIDNFKQINDQHGHLKGDEVLKVISECIRQHIRESDVPCRYGGDEFCIMLPDADAQSAQAVAERIIASFAEMHPDFSLSVGIVDTGPGQHMSLDDMIGIADKKMYQAKALKGSQIII
ncbi:GGDEF domain-containing protein [Amphritea pacifica]|uniref:Diguanylate cyclase DosC n=1 Tax=Amphritea pacifica TaxID=2811233 RepID=A0ABS2WBI3_9GAMM|nr:GGDEF domain-containing protein [Amphritea pacifica]MBN0988933.1 GGDEF domain-containing protein [Amphritea pacifica]